MGSFEAYLWSNVEETITESCKRSSVTMPFRGVLVFLLICQADILCHINIEIKKTTLFTIIKVHMFSHRITKNTI